MLSAPPGGFSGGNGTGFGAGGSSLWRIARIFLMRGDMGKRSAAIVSRSSAAIAAQSQGRLGCLSDCGKIGYSGSTEKWGAQKC